jgi:hypothetical protein
MRPTIENYIINVANNIQTLGLYRTIQLLLFGDAKNVCPRSYKW